MDGRTVYKISKQKSISPMNYNPREGHRDSNVSVLSQDEAQVAHNLSVRFENAHNSDPKAKKNKKPSHKDSDDDDLGLDISSIRKAVAKDRKKQNAKKGKSSRDSSESISVGTVKNASFKSYQLDPNILKPSQPQKPMTRNRMKSISSSSMNSSMVKSKNYKSSDEENSDSDSSSSSNVFDFMKSKNAKPAKNQPPQVLHQKKGGLLGIGKRAAKQSKHDLDSDGESSDSS